MLAARGESRFVLLNGIPTFLEKLEQALGRRTTPDGAAPAAPREHALQRAGLQEHSLDQVVMEYSLLRQTILAALEDSSPLEPGDRSVILDAVDLGIREATIQFVETHAQALRASDERFRLLVAGVRDYAIFMLDPEGRVVSWNRGAERLKGYTEEEILGRHFSLFYTAEDVCRGRPDQNLKTAAREDSIEDEGWRVRKDGSLFWGDVVVTAIRDEAGQLRGFAKVTRDTTDKRRMEEELRRHAEALEETNRRKDEFLAMLGHELRNPLSPIGAAVEILRLRGRMEPEDTRALDIIDRQVRHLTRLVDDLLDAARVTQGRLERHRERVELEQLVDQAADTLRPLIEERRQELLVSTAEAPSWIDADPTRITQVTANLLHNASKFTPRGGRISVVGSRERGQAVVRIRDTGAGIEPELLSSIFDLFVQGERSTERVQEGLGIGLTLVRLIVQMHGGTVEVYSAGPGTGSEFVVRLPLVLPEQDTVAAGAEVRQVPPTRPLDVLVVDDNVDAAATIAEVIRLWGHRASVAHSGEEALETTRAQDYDVLLVDIGLPSMNGYEVARALRQRPGSDKLCLVALTGFGQQSDLDRSTAEGFDRHLTKPVSLETLREILASER